MKRKFKLFGLVAMCLALVMVSACEIGESPIEIAKKGHKAKPKAPVRTVAPAVSNQPAVLNQPAAAEVVNAPIESAKPVTPEPLSSEALEQVRAWAMVDEDKGPLLASPDEKANVVQELPFATVLYVLNKESRQETVEGKSVAVLWYKVALTDNKTWGWILDRYIQESKMSPDQFKLDDLANFYYAMSASMKDKAARIKLLDLLIEQYPKAGIYFKEPDSQIVIQGNAKELAQFAIADIYRGAGEYQKSIDAYGTIIDEAKRPGVKGYAEWNLLKLYKNYMKDTQKTIEEALHIIDTYENLALTGYEWNIWVDLSAAEVLRDTLTSSGASGSDMVKYGETVIATNNYAPVQIIGSIIVAEGYRKQNDPAALENIILEILKQHPATPVQYYRNTVDYSTKALSFPIMYYIAERHDYGAALAFAQKVAASTSNETLINNAKFAIAYVYDIWHFGREEVIAAYTACGSVHNFLYENAFVSSDNRLSAIQRFESFNGTVGQDVASVFLEPVASSSVVFTLAKGDKVAVLYGNPPNFKGTWLKVKTGDNRFGWVLTETLDKAGLAASGDETSR